MSARRFDMEDFCASIEDLLKSKLNTQIEAIESEKNDDIKLKTIPDEAYFFQTLDERTANYNPFILYGIEDIATTPNGPFAVDELSVSVVVILEDNGIKHPIQRLLRYQRAMKQVFEKYWDQIEATKIEIKSLRPIELQALNSSNPFRAIGLNITAGLG